MTLSRIAPLLVFAALSSFPIKAATQDLQETFEKELIAACNQNDQPAVDNLIREHRLWVKPVVNQLISEYIELQLNSDEAAASKKKHCASLIANSFQQIFGEKSLAIGVGYLDGWEIYELNKKYISDSLNSEATSLRQSGQNTEQAINIYQQALMGYVDIGDRRGEAVVLGALGAIYWNLDTDSCLSYYWRALEARKDVDDKYLMGSTLNGIGTVHLFHLSAIEPSLEYLSQAVEVRKEIEDWVGLGNSYTYMATAYKNGGALDSAIHYYRVAYVFHAKTENQPRMAEAMLNSGLLLQLTGNYPEALKDLSSSLELYQSLNDTLYMGDALNQLALVYANLGDYEAGLESSSEALQLYTAAGDAWGIAGAYNHMGIILQNAGRPERASGYYEKSIEIYQELDDQQSVLSLINNLGTIYSDLGNYQEAEKRHASGLKLSREIESETGELHCLVNLANDQNMLGKLDEALINYDSGLQLAQSMNSPESMWKIMVGMAENYKLRGDYEKAIEFNEKGLKIVEEIRTSLPEEEYRTTYLARERYAFEDVIHMLGEMYADLGDNSYKQLAFEYAQRSKARSFLDLLAGTSSNDPVSMEEVQSGIPDKNSVFLEYSLGDSSSYLWIITPDEHQFIQLPSRDELRDKVETFRFAVVEPQESNLDFYTESAFHLYEQLVKPAEPYLKKSGNLVILPDGILHYIPFEALITKDLSEENEWDYTNLPYLVHEYSISYGHSSSVLKNLLEQGDYNPMKEGTQENLIAFGDPIYQDENGPTEMRSGLRRLPYSEKEVTGIAALFREGSAEVYLREKATEDLVKKEGILIPFRYIHFATHGLMDEQNPENSSLVLTMETEGVEDGHLQAKEIALLDLDAELVILSACQTGLGKMVRGEGMIGLTRSFMYSGTPSVISSLWSVSDASTTELMQRFYENLIQKKLSKTDALQRAQISMISDGQYAHPFYWAPFVLVGDWK